MKNGKRKASAKQNFVVGSFSRRERSIRGKEDKKKGEVGGGALDIEIERERENDPLPRNRHQFDFVMLRIFGKKETKQDEMSFTAS